MKGNILCILILLTFITCEDVVEVNLPPEDPKLIVEAFIKIDTTQESSPVRIIVNTTGSFFEEIAPTPIESMQIQNESITTIAGVLFLTPDPENPNEFVPGSQEAGPSPGGLVSNSFFLEGNLYLTFEYQDETYFSSTQFVPAPPINSLEQGDAALLDEDDTEIIVNFTDIPEKENFYLFHFEEDGFATLEDRFFPDQEFEFSYFYERPLQNGQNINVSILGADEPFYNYMNQLIEQSEMGSDNLFQTPVTTVRGNILKFEGINNVDLFNNVGRPQDFVLGYFAVAQENLKTITISN